MGTFSSAPIYVRNVRNLHRELQDHYAAAHDEWASRFAQKTKQAAAEGKTPPAPKVKLPPKPSEKKPGEESRRAVAKSPARKPVKRPVRKITRAEQASADSVVGSPAVTDVAEGPS